MPFSIQSIFPFPRWDREETLLDSKKIFSSGSKGSVIEKIEATTKGALFSFCPSQNMLPFFSLKVRSHHLKFKKREKSKKGWKRGVPMGLSDLDPEGKINALMQFALYVPGLVERFTFLPKSFFALRTFVDLYFDAEDNEREFCESNQKDLMDLFEEKFSGLGLGDIFKSLLQIIRPEWALYSSLDDLLVSSPSQIFLEKESIQKQVVSKRGFFLDLVAFIEKRPDQESLSYIAYVKVEGSWYQCDGKRVSKTRSDFFGSVLKRAVLACYRKV